MADDDALEQARRAKGTHAPTVEVDPTNELLDGDLKPLPQDLEQAHVVIDESGTRLVHEDPARQPGPNANLERLQAEGKLAAARAAETFDAGAADQVRALREEHEGLARRAKYDDNKKLQSRLGQVVDELKKLGASVEGDDEEGAVSKEASEDDKEAAAQRRAAEAERDAAAANPPKERRTRAKTQA